MAYSLAYDTCRRIDYSTYIYENDRSIDEDLSDEIVQLYEIESKKDDCPYIMMYNDVFSKYKQFLSRELRKSVLSYVIHLTESTSDEQLKRYFQRTFQDIENNVSDFKIMKHSIETDETIYRDTKVLRCYDKAHLNNVKILYYIWFLTDYDGILQFPYEHVVFPGKGKLILFPASWMFPYEQINRLDSQIIVISGYIYKKI